MAATLKAYAKLSEKSNSKSMILPPSKREAFVDALNAQFPDLELPAERQQGVAFFASQAEPKGNVTIWEKSGKCMLTGALTAVVWPA